MIHTINECKILPIKQFLESTVEKKSNKKPFTFKIEKTIRFISEASKRVSQFASISYNQFIHCEAGALEINVSDGHNIKTEVLMGDEVGLFIPSSLWIELVAVSDNTQIAIYCDQHFDESDQITNYEKYIMFRNSMGFNGIIQQT